MKKVISVLLAALMCFSLMVFASAEETETGTFKIASFNVAGLPNFEAFQGGEVDMDSVMSFLNNKTISNQKVIGKYIESCDYDIFATQEDFFYHDFLAAELKSYNYSTQWQGGVPWGDGTTVFTKNYKMTGEQHIKWDMLSGDGSAEDGADVYSRKGITYVCVEIADGVFVDFYDIHADAYGDEGSMEARKDNFRQLADLINSKNTGRPVIITGDFNISSHHTYDPSGVYFNKRLIEEEGYKDAWTELYNGGNYDDYSSWYSQGSYWGRWDSVEKFLYKDGTNVKIDCTDFSYNYNIPDEDGNHVSDHAMIDGVFTYTVTGSADSSEKPSKTETFRQQLYRRIQAFLESLYLGLSNIVNIIKNLTK